MFTSYKRLESTFSLSITVLFALLAAISLSSFVLLPSSVPNASIHVEPLSVYVQIVVPSAVDGELTRPLLRDTLPLQHAGQEQIPTVRS